MIHLAIASGVSAPYRCNLPDGSFTIGRGEGSKIRLRDPAISDRHAVLSVSGASATIEDIGSSNGTVVNGEAIAPSAPRTLYDGDTIAVGKYRITVTGLPQAPAGDAQTQQAEAAQEKAGGEAKTEATERDEAAGGDAPAPRDSESTKAAGRGEAAVGDAPAPRDSESTEATGRDEAAGGDAPAPRDSELTKATGRGEAAGGDAPAPRDSELTKATGQTKQQAPAPKENARDAEIRRQIKNQIHRELVQRLELKRLSASRTGGDELFRRARAKLDEIISEVKGKLPKGIDPAELSKEIFDEAMRLGPLEELLADDSVSEIMVNGPQKIYVERHGKLELTGQAFMDDASVVAIIERIVSPIGRRIDESQPYVDARLPDGSRVNAIIPPLSLTGPCVTIRKFAKTPLTVGDFIRFGTWTPEIAHFLEVCVKMRKNVIVAGGTGSGKTTLLNLLSSFIPPGERIVTIEDAAELRLEQPHLVRLESRPPNIEGKGAITIRDLVRNALRMRPDRIIVGECRGGEALDMLQAMNTGHDGSLTTVHANSPRDVISRLETMVLMSGMELPSRAIREQIASAVDLIVHESRFADGSRRITHVTEVMGLEGQQPVMQDLFEFKQTGVSAEGKIEGYLTATGSVPSFFEQIKLRGLELNPEIFTPAKKGGGRD